MDSLLLYFDLETTGLSKWNDRIVQIGATAVLRKSTGITVRLGDFETFVKSTIDIQTNASRITGITSKQLNTAPPIDKALSLWSKWLANLKRENELLAVPVTLIAYNGVNFDFPLLLMEMHRANIPSSIFFKTHNIGYLLDPYQWAKKHLNTEGLIRNAAGSYSFTLSNIYKSLTGMDLNNAHTALADTEGLELVCGKPEFAGMHYQFADHYCHEALTYCTDFIKLRRSTIGGNKKNHRQRVQTLYLMQTRKRKSPDEVHLE